MISPAEADERTVVALEKINEGIQSSSRSTSDILVALQTMKPADYSEALRELSDAVKTLKLIVPTIDSAASSEKALPSQQSVQPMPMVDMPPVYGDVININVLRGSSAFINIRW